MTTESQPSVSYECIKTSFENIIINIMALVAVEYTAKNLWTTVKFIKNMPDVGHLYHALDVSDVIEIVNKLKEGKRL